MWVENENGVTDHMLDEILERLRDDADAQDRKALRFWFQGMPIHVSPDTLQEAMTVLMHGPDTDTIAGTINGTRSGYHRAVSQMIELAAMWLLDLDGLSSGDADSLWAHLEDKNVDYVTETGLALKGIFGIDFLDREDFERFIDFRNNMNNSLVARLIERDDCELAAWWLSSRHTALEDDLWSDVEDMPREKERLRQDARKLAEHLRVSNPLIRHMAELDTYL
ncbi:MAG: hypothetical protein OXG68_02325 [Chloroflexi bacterium]|nr:hypothetical protein [Chloroflexota bacterium]